MSQYVVTAARVNFRSGPVIANNIITTLNRGQIVDAKNTLVDGEWLAATTLIPSQTEDVSGYINAQFVVEADGVPEKPSASGSGSGMTTQQVLMLTPNGKNAFIELLAANCFSVRRDHGLSVSPLHICHFMAQLAHESAGFRTMREFWGPTKAQQRYEGRGDLGNNQPGDGKRFMGRGYIQITGRANYARYGVLTGQPLASTPTLAEDPTIALNIACLYWRSRNIDVPAGKNDIAEVTRRINGGHNGLTERTSLLNKAMKIWK